MKLRLNTEVFILPEAGGTYIAYAPLRRLLMRLQPEQVNLLARLRQGHQRRDEHRSDWVKFLVRCGVINGPPEQHPPDLTGRPYQPTRATLFLTNRCNLACRYCYAAAGDRQPLDLSEEIGRAAIDYVAKNCVARKHKMLNIGYHGGGEPTVAWDALVALTAYARRVARRSGLKLRSGMSSNGCLSAEHARWIARHTGYISISVDGPPEIQDHFRPLRDGRPSSPLLMRTLRIFDRLKFPYSFQTTISAEIVERMPDIVRWFAKHTKPRFLKFEPVSDCGRYFGLPDRIPDGNVFARYFNQATEVARETGINLSFSGVRLWGAGVSYFCGAFAEPFAVTPDGHVSACYEAYSADTPYADVFLFGRWDPLKRDFQIDRAKLDRLRKRNVYRLQPCARCFCKYSCGGDCATRNFRSQGYADLDLVGARCDAIRGITSYRLSRYLDQKASAASAGKETSHGKQAQRKRGPTRAATAACGG